MPMHVATARHLRLLPPRQLSPSPSTWPTAADVSTAASLLLRHSPMRPRTWAAVSAMSLLVAALMVMVLLLDIPADIADTGEHRL